MLVFMSKDRKIESFVEKFENSPHLTTKNEFRLVGMMISNVLKLEF